MAYQDALTGQFTGNFAYFTKRQAAVIYRNFKSGNITMSKEQVRRMYDAVGDTTDACAYEYFNKLLGFVMDGRTDLAQAMLDGKSVEWETVMETVEVTLTQEIIDEACESLECTTEDGVEISFFDVIDLAGNEYPAGTKIQVERVMYDGYVVR